MNDQLHNAVNACIEGHCAFVDVTYAEPAVYSIMWCRYCGKLEVYEMTNDGGSVRSVNLTPKVTNIVREMLDD